MTKALNEGKNKELQEKAYNLLLSENTAKVVMRLAGYKESYVQCNWKRWLENINPDEIRKRLRSKTALFSDTVINKAFEWMEKDDPRWGSVVAKIHGDVTRTHLEDKAPTALVFNFQTVQKVEDKAQNDGDIVDVSPIQEQIKDKSGV